MEDSKSFSCPPSQPSAIPSWIIFVAGLLSALMLFLAGVALGYISIKPLSLTTETSTSAQNQSTTSAAVEETAGWKTCTNSKLNLSLKYPDSTGWGCAIDVAPYTGSGNIVIDKDGNKYFTLTDSYNFSPTPDSNNGRKEEIGNITLENKSFKIYFWPDRTNLPQVLEQIVYATNNTKTLYFVSDDYDKLTTKGKDELKSILQTIQAL